MKPQTGTQNWLKPPNRQTIIDPLDSVVRVVAVPVTAVKVVVAVVNSLKKSGGA